MEPQPTKGKTMRMLTHFILGLLTGGVWWVWLVVWHFIKD